MRDSSENPLLFRTICHWFSYVKSAQKKRSFSSAFSCDFQRSGADSAGTEKGEKEAESTFCGKAAPRRARPPAVVVREHTAHTMWHVEQFTVSRPRRRDRRGASGGPV